MNYYQKISNLVTALKSELKSYFGDVDNDEFTDYLHSKLKDIDLKDYKIIITEDLVNFSYLLTSMIYLFFDESQIIVINDKKIIKFNETYIVKDYSYKYNENMEYILEKLKSCYKIDNTTFHENIFLIKSSVTKNPLNKCFNNEYNEYLVSKGFKLVIPEHLDVTTLYKTLYNAKNIIMSWGCCSYLNSDFVNENSSILVLCHSGYKPEYDKVNKEYNCSIFETAWFPRRCKKKNILYDLESEFNNNTKLLLDEKINELII